MSFGYQVLGFGAGGAGPSEWLEATGGTTPDGSTSFIEGLKSLFFDVTVHNSYGEGKPNGASKKYWQDSPDGKAKFILIPASNNKEVLKK